MSAPNTPTAEHYRLTDELVADTVANNGLAPVDLDRFWADAEIANADPFGRDIPQVAWGATLTDECVYAELDMAEDFWRYQHDSDWALSLNRRYNDLAEPIVGRRLLNETPPDPVRAYPPVKGLHDIFEARNEWHDQSWWLMPSADTREELAALLDRVADRDVRSFVLPENWAEEKARLTALGVQPPLYRHQRGPVTFATSIFGTEKLIYLILEDPDLAGRLRDLIAEKMIELVNVLDEEAGYTAETRPAGFSFADDNCCLLNPQMYAFFAFPILQRLFAHCAPAADDWRYQHSDSAMGHLLPLLGKLDMRGLNLGPTVTVTEIREHCPNALIYGQLAPFTYSRNEQREIVAEIVRDIDLAGDARGLVVATAGSINNGTRLTSMRLAMAAIQRYGRYD
jgi:uroporphyrinogen decarboxylase